MIKQSYFLCHATRLSLIENLKQFFMQKEEAEGQLVLRNSVCLAIVLLLLYQQTQQVSTYNLELKSFSGLFVSLDGFSFFDEQLCHFIFER